MIVMLRTSIEDAIKFSHKRSHNLLKSAIWATVNIVLVRAYLSITDKRCFEKDQIENSLACGLYGEILLKTNRSSIALKPLTRACEVGKIWNSCLLSALTYFEYALDVDEVIKYMTMARDLAYDKKRYNKIIKKLQDCKADKECNPAKLEFQ